MPTFKEQITWRKETVDDPIESFADFIKEDFYNYLVTAQFDSKRVRLLLGIRLAQFEHCGSIDDIRR